MQHHELECHAKRLVCCFQCQGHSKGSYDQNLSFVFNMAHMIRICLSQYSFWTADPFATKLGFIVHYHKPECPMKKLDYYLQGQGHSKISKCWWMFVQTISSESLNFLLPNLVKQCTIVSQIVFQKDWFTLFMVMVTVEDHVSKYDLLIYPELLILLELNLSWWHTIIS